MRRITFTTAVLLPLFLIDLIEALLPLDGLPKLLAAMAAAALLMVSAGMADNWLERRRLPDSKRSLVGGDA